MNINVIQAAIDHTQVHGFAIEEALAIELQGKDRYPGWKKK
jgi:hypothetical protein